MLFDTLNDIWHFSKKHQKWKLDVTERFLLAPYSTNYVDCTRQDSSDIKQALFDFLASVDPSDINLHIRMPVVIY